MIQTSEHLQKYLTAHSLCPLVGFDTEFVSEDTYQPELSLIQINADNEIALIDPYAIEDLTPFWNWLIDDLRTVCLLYTSPSPRDRTRSRMPSSA